MVVVLVDTTCGAHFVTLLRYFHLANIKLAPAANELI